MFVLWSLENNNGCLFKEKKNTVAFDWRRISNSALKDLRTVFFSFLLLLLLLLLFYFVPVSFYSFLFFIWFIHSLASTHSSITSNVMFSFFLLQWNQRRKWKRIENKTKKWSIYFTFIIFLFLLWVLSSIFERFCRFFSLNTLLIQVEQSKHQIKLKRNKQNWMKMIIKKKTKAKTTRKKNQKMMKQQKRNSLKTFIQSTHL